MYELTANDRLALQALYDNEGAGFEAASWTDIFLRYGELGGEGSPSFVLQQLVANGWVATADLSMDDNELIRYWLLSRERVEQELYGGLLNVAFTGGVRLRVSALAGSSH